MGEYLGNPGISYDHGSQQETALPRTVLPERVCRSPTKRCHLAVQEISQRDTTEGESITSHRSHTTTRPRISPGTVITLLSAGSRLSSHGGPRCFEKIRVRNVSNRTLLHQSATDVTRSPRRASTTSIRSASPTEPSVLGRRLTVAPSRRPRSYRRYVTRADEGAGVAIQRAGSYDHPWNGRSTTFRHADGRARGRPPERGPGWCLTRRRHPCIAGGRGTRAFQCGATPETIVQSYDTLSLSDVYAVLAYCPTHREEIDEYMRRCEAEAADVLRPVQATHTDQSGVRERLMQRVRDGRIAPAAE